MDLEIGLTWIIQVVGLTESRIWNKIYYLTSRFWMIICQLQPWKMPRAEFRDAFDSAIRINPRRDDIPGTIIPDAGYVWGWKMEST